MVDTVLVLGFSSVPVTRAMNTQTHMMMAVALVLPLAQTRSVRSDPRSSKDVSRWPERLLIVAAVLGGVIPDATVALMILIGMVQHVPNEIIFREWYFNDFWQGLGAMTNSIPLYALLALGGWLLCRRHAPAPSRLVLLALILLVVALSSLLHCLTDFPLHHDDGRPHFWPLTDWVYQSPVSYWNPAYHGRVWSVIEMLLMAGFALVIWRRYTGVFARTFTMITAMSLLAVSGMWGLMLG